jgi:uncharacterized damage-inducible protein DinB
MKDHLIDLFKYDHWANTRWLDRLRALDDVAPRVRELMAHLPATKRVWITRLRGEDASDVPIWPSLHWDACARLLDATYDDYQVFLDQCSDYDLTSAVAYLNSKGVEFQTPVREVLMHVITHNHYHRGQITQAVRQQGDEPVNTDYITYTRQR